MMKKIIFAMGLLTTLSVNAKTALICNTSDNEAWKNMTTSDELVIVRADNIADMPTGYDEWYFAPGKYILAGTPTTTANVYGGFTGQESSIDAMTIDNRERTDLDGNGLIEPWELKNRVYFQSADAMPTTSTGIRLTIQYGSTWDGVTFRNMNTNAGRLVSLGKALGQGPTTVPTNQPATLNNSILEDLSSAVIVNIDNFSTVNGCLIQNCTPNGPAIDMEGYQCVLTNSKIRNNNCSGQDGLVITKVAMDQSTPTIENCIFHNNSLVYGTVRGYLGIGVKTAFTQFNVINCTFSNNLHNNGYTKDEIEFIGGGGNVVNCLINTSTGIFSIRQATAGTNVAIVNCFSNKGYTTADSPFESTNSVIADTIIFNGTVPTTLGNVATTDADYDNVMKSTFSLNAFPVNNSTSYYGASEVTGMTIPTTDIIGNPQVDSHYAIGAYNPIAVLNETSTNNASSIANGNMNVTTNRTLTKGQWAAVYLPFSMTAEQVSATFGDGTKVAEYDEANSTDNTLKFTTSTSGITANMPFIIYPTNDVSNFTLNNTAVAKSTTTPTIATDKYSFVGTYDYTTYSTTNDIAYIGAGDKIKSLTSGGSLKGLSSHFEKTTAGAKELNFVVDGNVTGIYNISTKTFEDNDGKYYNVNGQRVNSRQKGIIINNGKKYINK